MLISTTTTAATSNTLNKQTNTENCRSITAKYVTKHDL